MRNNKTASLFPKELVIESLKQSFVKLNPRMMFRNPIMFIVEVVTFVMLFVTIWAAATGDTTQGSFGYNILVFIVLFATLLFANFAEAIAEARGKAQADSLRKTREETPAKLCVGNKIETVSSSQLKKGDIFICEAGDTIPSDGEIHTQFYMELEIHQIQGCVHPRQALHQLSYIHILTSNKQRAASVFLSHLHCSYNQA